MSDNQQQLPKLIEHISITEDMEIDCSQAATQMEQIAAANLSEAQSRHAYPDLWHHFQFCPDCRAEYEMLVALAQAYHANELTAAAALPTIPGQTDSLLQRLQRAVDFLFGGFETAVFSTDTSAALRRSHRGELFGDPVEIELDDDLLIIFDVKINEAEPTLSDLFCTVETADLADPAALEGFAAWLLEDDKTVLSEQSLDISGDVLFSQLIPGAYTLLLHINGRDYVINNLIVP